MKKSSLLWAISLIISFFASGQDNYLVAKQNGEGYDLLISRKSFAAVFDSQIAPYLNPGLGQRYSFQDISIDDPEPGNVNSRAYLEVKAASEGGTVTVGVKLIKDVNTEQVTKLYITKYNSFSGQTPERMTEEAGWKCTSSNSQCGGCVKIRYEGNIVGCRWVSEGNTFCKL